MKLSLVLAFVALAATLAAASQPKIFGVGLSETGQSSVTAALQALGLRTVQNDASFIPYWTDNFHFSKQYEDVDAVMDIPTAAYFEIMLQAYPDAKFILTERDADSWFVDVSQYFELLQRVYGGVLPEGLKKLLEVVYGSATPEPNAWKDRYLAHNLAVRNTIPFEQLLVLSVYETDGYAQLCAFLGRKDGVCGGADEKLPFSNNLEILTNAAHASAAYATCHPMPSVNKHAYVFFVSHIDESRDAFVSALVQALAVQRTNTTADIVLLVKGELAQVDADLCAALGIKVRRVHGVGHDVEVSSDADESVRRAHADQRARLRALQLVEYESVIVMDSDFLVKQNMDALLVQPAPLTIQAGYLAPVYTGWFIVRPSCQDFNNINEIARSGTFNPVSGWMYYGEFPHWREHRAGELSQWSFEGASSDAGLLYYYYFLHRGDIQILSADYDFESEYFTRFASSRKPWLIARDEISDVSLRLQAATQQWWALLDQLQNIAAEANIDIDLETSYEVKVAKLNQALAVRALVQDPYGGGGSGSGMGTGGQMPMTMPMTPIAQLIKSLPGPAQFAIGVAEAFIGRILPSWVNCLRGVKSLATSVQSLFQDFHSGIVANLKQSVEDLASILSTLQGIIKDCGLTEVATKIATFCAKVYSGFGDIVIGAKIVINGVNIYHNFDDALHAWKTGDWETMGKDVGSIIGYVI